MGKIFSIIILALSVGLLTACGSSSGSNGTNNPPITTPSPPSSIRAISCEPARIINRNESSIVINDASAYQVFQKYQSTTSTAADNMRALPIRRLLLDSVFRGDGKLAKVAVSEHLHSKVMFAIKHGGEELLTHWRHNGLIQNGGFTFDAHRAQLEMLGGLHQTVESAAAWQLRAGKNRRGAHEWNAGVLARKMIGNNVLGGLHVFYDWQKQDVDIFRRTGIGSEARHAWADIFAAVYFPLGDGQQHGNSRRYSAGGFDALARVHSPQRRWLSGEAGYSFFRGKYGHADEKQLHAGLHVEFLQTPWQTKINYRDDSDRGNYWHLRFGGEWDLGGQQKPVAVHTSFRPQEFLFAAPKREYGQRIRTAVVNQLTNNVDNLETVAVINVGDAPSQHNAKRWGKLLQKSIRYVVQEWWPKEYNGKETQIKYVNFRLGSKRGAPQYVFALAINLVSGNYDASVVGVSEVMARQMAVQIVRSMAACHLSNHADIAPDNRECVQRWGGDIFQAATWVAHVAAAGWMLWPHLDSTSRYHLQKMVEYSASRVAARGPEYANERICSDSAAENNGWDAWILEIATNMYPRHAHAGQWRRAAEEYRAATLSRFSENNLGYNLSDDYAIGNHGIYPHPSYTAAVARQSLLGMLYYRLGGQEPPQVNRRNIANIYNMMVQYKWYLGDYTQHIAPSLHGKTIYDASGIINWPGNKEAERAKNYWTYASLDALVKLANLDVASQNHESVHLAKLEDGQQKNGAIVTRSDIPQHHQWQQVRDVAAVYLGYWIAHNRGGSI